ncbi:MAG: hypothetical protein HYW78_02965 [Parcubacteria group bacterium]|nr:hypothetical protein [Parcubacteria group bacterium]
MVFSIYFIFFLFAGRGIYFTDPDSFYHAKISLMMNEALQERPLQLRALFPTELPWMQFSSLKNNFVDHHWLFHLALIPFLSLPNDTAITDPALIEIDPILKFKIAISFFAGIFGIVLYYALSWHTVRFPFAFVFLPLTSLFIVGRFINIRTLALAAALLLLMYIAVARKKNFLLFFLSMIYVWLHGSWPLAIVLIIEYYVALYIHTYYIAPRSSPLYSFRAIITFLKNCDKKPFFAVIGGLVAGLVINPYFPYNLSFYLYQTSMVAYSGKVMIGAEWHPTDSFQFLKNSLFPFLLWIITFPFFLTSLKKHSFRSYYLAILSTTFLLLTIKSLRFSDYFTPFSILFAGMMFNAMSLEQFWHIAISKINKMRRASWRSLDFWLTCYIAVCLIILIITPFISIFSYLNKYTLSFATKNPTTRSLFSMQSVSAFLKNTTAPRSIVFHSMWDLWPQLFYFNDYNYYINGLAPMFLNKYNPQLYETMDEIIYNTSTEPFASSIKNNFSADIVLTEKTRPTKFVERIEKDPSVKKIYSDVWFNVYRIEGVK